MTKNRTSMRFTRLLSTLTALFVAMGALVLQAGRAFGFDKKNGGNDQGRRRNMTPGFQGHMQVLREMGFGGKTVEPMSLAGRGRTTERRGMVNFFVPAMAQQGQMETMMLQLAGQGGDTMKLSFGAGRRTPAQNGMGGASA